jgi:disulfide bond formation protein DsbB
MSSETTFAELATNPIADQLNYNLSLATLIGAGVLVVWLVVFLTTYFKNSKSAILSFIAKYALPLGFFATLLGSFLSLYYSQVIGYAPCELCWYQRIFLYSQVVLFGIAWARKESSVLTYTLGLSVVGGAIAVYHHILQMGFDLYKPCSTAPFAVDCAKPSFIEFGFVSFPFMGIVLFGFVLLLSLTAKFARKA